MARPDRAWEADALKGAYWLKEPAAGAEAAIIFSGAVAPEATAAWEAMLEDFPGMGLLAVTSPDRLHRDWSAQKSARWDQSGTEKPTRTKSHIENLLSPLSPSAGLVTVLDGSPAALSWIGGVSGHRVSPLGTDRFGQTGDLPDLYRTYRIDSEAVIEAMVELCL